MAAPTVTAGRIRDAADVLYSRIRDVVGIREALIAMGGVGYIEPALDPEGEGEDPAPDLSAAQMAQAFTAVQSLYTILGNNDDQHRIGLLDTFLTPAKGVDRARTCMRQMRDALAELMDLRQDCVDAGGQTWLGTELDAETVAKIVACMAAVQALQTQLDANSGADRKSIRRAAN